jgi:N-acetylneuraminic acid mutarotase
MDPLDTIEVLDAGSWQTLDVTLPEALGHMAAATLDGQIHIVGGGSHAHFQEELIPPFSSGMAIFDGKSLTASDMALPMPRSGAHLVPNPDGGLVLAGGYGQVHEGEVCEGDGSPVAQTQIFSPQTRSWTRGPELPWPVRHGVASVTEDGLNINFVGGLWNVSHGEKGVFTMQIGVKADAPELEIPSAPVLFI